MQFGSKEWGNRDRSGRPDRYLGAGRSSRNRSYEPNEARSGAGGGSGGRYIPEDTSRSHHGSSWSTGRSHQWETNSDPRMRSYDYLHRSTYGNSPRTHSTSTPTVSRQYPPSDWNPENPNPNLQSPNLQSPNLQSPNQRFTEEAFSDPGEDVPGSPDSHTRSYWKAQSTYTRPVEQYDYQHERGYPNPSHVPPKEVHNMEVRRNEDDHVQPPAPVLPPTGLPRMPSVSEPIDVLELANKISSLGPLIRDPRLLTKILKITKTDENLTSPKREETSILPLSTSVVPNPSELQWSKPSGNRETFDQSSRQSKLTEYSQKYKIVKKSHPPPPPPPAAPPASVAAAPNASANSLSATVAESVEQIKAADQKIEPITQRKDPRTLAVSNGGSISPAVVKSNEESDKKHSSEMPSVPLFASKAQMLVKDSFIKRKQEGRAKMSTPACKSDMKQNQALLKLVAGTKEDMVGGDNTGSSPHTISSSTPIVKIPGMNTLVSSVMKTSLSQVLRNSLDSPKTSPKDEAKKPVVRESDKQTASKTIPSIDSKSSAQETEAKLKSLSETTDSMKESNKNLYLDSGKDSDSSKQVPKPNRARKGQNTSEKSQNAVGQQAAIVTRKQAAITSKQGKKKMKKRHFRGATYNLYLSTRKKKKRGSKDLSQGDDELSMEGTETTGSQIDSEDDVSYASEELMTASEKSFQDDDVSPSNDKSDILISEEKAERRSLPLENLKKNLSYNEASDTDAASDKPARKQVKPKDKTSSKAGSDYPKEEICPKKGDGVKQDGDMSQSATGNMDEVPQTKGRNLKKKTEKIDGDVVEDQTSNDSKEDMPSANLNVDQLEGDTKGLCDRPPLSPENSETVCSSAESHTLSDGEINKENTPFLSPKHLHSIASSVKTRQRVKRRHGESDSDVNSTELHTINGTESPFKKPKRIQSSGLTAIGIPVVPAHPVTNLAKIANACFPKLDIIYDHKRLKHSACTCQAKPVEARSCDTGKAKIYCQAVDSIDEKLIGCCNIVAKPQLVRPSKKIPFTAMCEVHLWRLRHHHCCPVCGVFCSQGFFLQCVATVKGKTQIHLFHKCCLVANEDLGVDLCPHCGESQDLKSVQLELNTPTAPTFYLSQKPLFSEPRAKMTITRLGTEEKIPPEDLTANKYSVPETEKVLSAAGLPVGPERSKLDKLLGEFNTKELDSSKCTLQHLRQAAKDGHLEKTLQLLARGLDPNLKEDEIKDVPLHLAAMNGHLAIVHVLMQAGASVDRLDDHLYTPLMLAVENYQTEVSQYLVKSGAQLLAKGEDGMTCLHLAARCGSVPICRMLLDTGRITPNVQDDGGWTPIVWAAEHSHLDVVRLLVERGADPNMRDNEQNIALHWSAFSGNVDISHLFLELGSDLTATNEHGDTPLHIAARQNKYACVVLFLARGSDIESVNKENETPLMCCGDTESQTYMALLMNKELKKFAQNRIVKAEKVIHSDISKGKELNCIQCVNGIDEEKVPTDYMYVTENCETSTVNLDRTITSLQSCRCEDDCTSPNCTCATLSFKCWFDNDGRLLPEFNLSDPPMIFECNRACLCWKNCNNRALQHGILCRLQLFRTHNKGWGVRTLKDIPKGTFICEYIGEIITDGEADQREDDSYLFDLDNRFGDGETYCLDARYYGNVSRFVNHQCEPNLVPVKIFVDHQDLSFPRIAFFSSRDIYAEEELGFDYGEKFWVIKYKSFTCDCGSPNCKYSKNTIHQTLENYYRRLKEEHADESIEGQHDAAAVQTAQ